MQLHACLLLFIITTDTTLASSRRHCGGNASLDREPAGHISLTLSGLFANTTTLNSTTDQSNETLPVSVCTWTISILAGRTVLLKLLWLESGSSITVRCLRNEEDHVLEIGGTALLSSCFGNKATLSWTGEGRSSNPIQLSYYVQEDERNSSGEHASPHSDRDLVHSSVTGTSFTSKAPVVREAVRGTEWGKGRLYEGVEEWGSGPWSASSLPFQNQGPLHATSTRPQRLTAAGNADRETLSLPEEGQNNGADTSGAIHHTNGSIYTSDGTHPYFEHTLTTESLFGTSHPTETEEDSSRQLPETQMSLEAATASGSDSGMVTDTHRHKAAQMLELSTTQEYPPVSSSRMPNLTSSHPELPSWRTREDGTNFNPHAGAVSPASEEKQHSWRGHRSTDRLASEPTSAITHDPLRLPTDQQQGESSDAPTDTEPMASASSSSSSSSSFSEGPSTVFSPTTHTADLTTALHYVEAASLTPNTTQNESSASTVTDATIQSSEMEPSDRFEDTEGLHTFTFSTQSHTDSPGGTESAAHSTPPSISSPFTHTAIAESQMATLSTQSHLVNTDMTTNAIFPTTDGSRFVDRTSSGSSSTSAAGPTLDIQNSAATETPPDTKTDTLLPTYRVLHNLLPTNSPTLAPHMSSGTAIHSSTPSYTAGTHSALSGSPLYTHTSLSVPFTTTESPGHMTVVSHRIAPLTSQAPTVTLASSHTHQTQSSQPLPSSRNFLTTAKNARDFSTPAHPPLLSVTSVTSEYTHQEVDKTKEHESGQGFPSITTAGSVRQPRPWTSVHPSEESHTTPTSSASTSTWSSSSSQKPKFYIVPYQPAAIKVESVELLLQIIVEESKPAFAPGLEEDAAAWVQLYLQRAPGFSRMLGVWSSGHAVQCLAEFNTSGALQWLGTTGPTSLLEQTGLAQAVQLGRRLTSPKIINITLGGVQANVCDWLLQCPAGYKCVSQPGSSNYSCSSDCHFDYCHHHGICTHHRGQLPVCHCQVGEDFWYMGQKCDIRMTRARLVGACLAILLIMVTVIAVLAFLAVRRYRALLIQAKVDQTRSSYRRFNHFDELSGRFWLRSWAESADSLDNPAFTRSDELLHLRALDRPCCYHDDTLSLASTCPSHGACINTIYPHSSQYGWRGSEMSMGDGVLDSGKASDLSVCSWPVEPIQWTPFPLLQHLASHRTPTVRVSRPRSYCEGMELVDMGKSWTA